MLCCLLVNCTLASVDTELLSSVRTKRDGKYDIHHDVVRVERVPSGELASCDELLLSYDGALPMLAAADGYWERQAKAPAHCLMCFRLDDTKANSMLRCQVNGCKTARHLLCLPAVSEISEATARRTRFLCAPHFFVARQADPQLRTSCPRASVDGRSLQTTAELHAQRVAAVATTRTAGAAVLSPQPTSPALSVRRSKISIADLCTPPRAKRTGASSAADATTPEPASATARFPHASKSMGCVSPSAKASVVPNRLSDSRSEAPKRTVLLADLFGAGNSSAMRRNILAGRLSAAVAAVDAPSSSPQLGRRDINRSAAAVAAAVDDVVSAAAANTDDDFASDTEEEDEFALSDSDADPDAFVDSEEDVESRVTRRIARQLALVARAADHAARDPETGQQSKHCALSVRSSNSVRGDSSLNADRLRLSEQDAADLCKILNTALESSTRRVALFKKAGGRRLTPWFLKVRFDELPDWKLYKEELAAKIAAPSSAAAAGLKSRIKTAQRGRSGWTSALQIAKDWAEYSQCCGERNGRTAEQLRGMMVQPRMMHSSKSVKQMMEKRIVARAAHLNKQAFAASVSQALEASVLSSSPDPDVAKQTLVAWDGGHVCHSCYRAVLGIGRSSLFKFKARLNMRANVHSLKAAAASDPQSKLLPRLIAMAEAAAEKPVYALRKQSSTALVKALLLDYCTAYAQHDPAAAGSKSTDKTHYTLPQHGLTALHSALDADLAERIVTQRQLSDPTVKLPPPPPCKPDGTRVAPHIISKSTLERVRKHLATHCNVVIHLTKQKGVCRCDFCDTFAACIKKSMVGSLERQLLELQLADHLKTAGEQRKLFDDHKALAIKSPLQQWTITFDGFDKSKTVFPSRPRTSKSQDAHKKSLIGMHVVGVFAFGAPLPVMAFFNDESVPAGANLAASILYEVLEKQWQKLVNDYLEQLQPSASSGQLPDGAADPAVDAEVLKLACEYAASKWPRRLHLTFDNTKAEAKNTTFFKAMAALVHYGVFEAITMSMLLVGHTHDIVDQMFRYAHTRHTLAVLQTSCTESSLGPGRCRGASAAADDRYLAILHTLCQRSHSDRSLLHVLCCVCLVCGLWRCASPTFPRCRR